MKIEMNKYLLIFSFLFLFLSFSFNSFSILSNDKYEWSKHEISESLILGRLLNSQNYSILDEGGFPGQYITDSTEYSNRDLRVNNQFKNYFEESKQLKIGYNIYTSQIGGQGVIYSIFQNLFHFTNETNYKIFRYFNTFLFSLVLILFIYWASLKFGTFSSIVLFLFIFFSPWLVLLARSIWWCNWSYLVILVIMLIYVYKCQDIYSFKYYFLYSILIFLKLWFTGFEFITVVLIASTIPMLFFALNNHFVLKKIIKILGLHISIAIIPIFLCIMILIFQNYLLTGNWKDGIMHFLDAFKRRSLDTYEQQIPLLENLQKFRLDMVVAYLGNNAFEIGFLDSKIKIPFLTLILVNIICSLFLVRKNLEKYKNICLVTAYSILAPLSWLVIFNQHAFVHKHIDFMIWYYPYLLFVFLLVGISLNEFSLHFQGFRRRKYI